MTPFTVRPETPADILAIERVTQAAFENAPHTEHNEHLIVRALRAHQALSVSLVAECDSAIIGHVAVSPVMIDDENLAWFGLGPLSVTPEFQRLGVGSMLMEHALAGLRLLGASGCVLLGDPAYYSRFGFRPERQLLLPGVPAEYFQALAFAGGLPTGTIRYDSAFEVED